jgi:hypothetical protein
VHLRGRFGRLQEIATALPATIDPLRLVQTPQLPLPSHKRESAFFSEAGVLLLDILISGHRHFHSGPMALKYHQIVMLMSLNPFVQCRKPTPKSD